MPAAVVNGARINYLQLEQVDAPVRDWLVMVHGLATSLAFWYLQYAPVFVSRFRVLLYDLRGHGRSEVTASGYRPADLAGDLSSLLDHLDIEQAHVLAHSFGGSVAMNLAVRDPGRVSSLVLADTHISAVRHLETPREWAFGRAMQVVLDRYGLELDTRDPYFGYRLLTRIAKMRIDGFSVPAELRELVGPLNGRQGAQVAARWLHLMRSTQAEAEMMGDDGLSLESLRSFAFPILAMYGDRSQARLTGTELLQVWPHARFRRVRDAGHFFPLSRPHEMISQCQRFWDGGFLEERPHRVGEQAQCHFRSDRVFEVEGAWYFATRESNRIGPFAAADEAQASLRRYMTASARNRHARH